MYKQLLAFCDRPAPFSRYTAQTLWTDPHIASQMLAYHLDPSHDIASRSPEAIQSISLWMDERIGLAGKRLTDLGCGPGLYSSEFARLGAQVTGCDFSASSLAHARSVSRKSSPIEYRHMDYLADPLPEDQDVFALIYGDVCALSPAQRAVLLSSIYEALRSGGTFVLDAFPKALFSTRIETFEVSHRLMDGFWSQSDYFGFLSTFLYPGHSLILDRYLIAEAHRTFEVFNWLQCFSPETLAGELVEAGFKVGEAVDAVTGAKWSDPERMFALVAYK